MYGLAWIMIVLSLIRRCGNDFSDSSKIIAESPHLWHKIIIHTNPYIILYIYLVAPGGDQ